MSRSIGPVAVWAGRLGVKRIREAIVADPGGWSDAIEGLTLGGERLKRPPRGFPGDHPLVEELKRKDFICTREFTERDAISPGFLGSFTDACRDAVPMMRFVTRAMDLEF